MKIFNLNNLMGKYAITVDLIPRYVSNFPYRLSFKIIPLKPRGGHHYIRSAPLPRQRNPIQILRHWRDQDHRSEIRRLISDINRERGRGERWERR
jgi:hypothetical protein